MSTHRILTDPSMSCTDPMDRIRQLALESRSNTISSTPRRSYKPRWTKEEMEKDLQQSRLKIYQQLNKLFGLDDLPADLAELAERNEQAEQAEQDEQAVEENPISPALEPCLNMASAKSAGEQADSVRPSVEELGTPLELAEQAVEENPVSPASEPCQNMASPNFAGEQAHSVPPSVDQLGTLPAPKIRPYHVPDSATHMAPANSPADVVPSRVWIMDFRNLQYRRHVKHLVDHTDVASMGGNTINTSDYACSS